MHLLKAGKQEYAHKQRKTLNSYRFLQRETLEGELGREQFERLHPGPGCQAADEQIQEQYSAFERDIVLHVQMITKTIGRCKFENNFNIFELLHQSSFFFQAAKRLWTEISAVITDPLLMTSANLVKISPQTTLKVQDLPWTDRTKAKIFAVVSYLNRVNFGIKTHFVR